jgi:hypothetical protein
LGSPKVFHDLNLIWENFSDPLSVHFQYLRVYPTTNCLGTPTGCKVSCRSSTSNQPMSSWRCNTFSDDREERIEEMDKIYWHVDPETFFYSDFFIGEMRNPKHMNNKLMFTRDNKCFLCGVDDMRLSCKKSIHRCMEPSSHWTY